jgi:hypothetical protein
MAVTNTLLTYGDVSRVDDVVLNAVEILTAEEAMLLSTLGKSSAKDTVHSFLVDTLTTPASKAVQMGADFTASALTMPSRLTNIVQEVAETFLVSRVQEKVQHYNGTNALAYQTSKALKNWGNSAEFDLVRSTLVSGVSGTVAKMNGVIVAISKSSNTTAHTSGTVFSASILDALMQNNMDNSNGDVATNVYVGGVMRRAIDNFVAKTNQVINNPGGPTSIIKAVQTYTTAFGTLTINYHRYVQQSGDATGRVLAIRPEKLKIAYLDMPYVKDLAENGAYSKKSVYGSMTLEVNNQDSHFFTSGFLLSA